MGGMEGGGLRMLGLRRKKGKKCDVEGVTAERGVSLALVCAIR